MNTNTRAFHRHFDLSCEHRILHLNANAGGNASKENQQPEPYQRHFRLDSRVMDSMRTSQENAQRLVGDNRWWFTKLYQSTFGTGVEREAALQRGQRYTENEAYDRAGRFRAWQLLQHPVEYREQAKKKLEAMPITFEAMGTSATPGVDAKYSFAVNFQNKRYWEKMRTEKEIAADIMKKKSAVLGDEFGIVVTPATVVFDEFSEKQAKEVAKFLMVQYVRQKLGYGMISEFNVTAAEKILRENPEFIKLLMSADEEEENEKKKRKKNLVIMIEQLKSMSGKTFPANFDDIESEYNKIEADLKLYPNSATDFTSKQLLAEAQNWAAITAYNDKRDVKQKAENKRDSMQDGLTYYRMVANLLDRIYAQVQSIEGLQPPSAFSSLFTGTTVNKTNLHKDTNPGALADLLTRELKDLDDEELKKEVGHEKKKAPIGAKAIKEIYKKDFIEHDRMDETSAETAAIKKFWSNEPMQQENEQLEDEIYTLTGGRLTWTGGIKNGIWASIKGLFTGSDESYICSIAESPEIQVPMGVGTGATDIRHKILESAEWTGAGAAAGAGLGAIGGITSATVSAAAVQSAVAVGAATGGIAALGVPALACFSKMRKAWKENESGIAALWFGAGAGILAGGGYAAATLGVPAIGAAIAGLGAVTVPPVALAAGIGAGLWAFLKVTKLDRRLFGSRQLAFLWPRWGARPEWTVIQHDRVKLKIAWDALVKGVKDGKLNKETWYVQSQLQEVGRLVLQNMLEEMGGAAGLRSLSSEDWDNFSMQNRRLELQRQIHEMTQLGIASLGGKTFEPLARSAKATVDYASTRQASVRRGVGNFLFNGGLSNWLNKKR